MGNKSSKKPKNKSVEIIPKKDHYTPIETIDKSEDIGKSSTIEKLKDIDKQIDESLKEVTKGLEELRQTYK